MQLHEFLNRVQENAHLASREEAVNATRATFETLSDRLLDNEPLHVGAQLPRMLQQYLHEGEGERFSREEFIHRVAQREGCDLEAAREHVEAVFAVVSEAIDRGEMKDLLAQLPDEYHDLFGEAPRRMM